MNARLAFVILALALISSAWTAPAWAQASSCDVEFSEAQKTQREFCDAHPGCTLVTSLMDSCISVKRFLNALGMGKNAPSAQKRMNDAMVREALTDIGVPAPGLSSCTTSFDRNQCLQYLGVKDTPIPPPTPAPYKPTAEQEIAAEHKALMAEWDKAKSGGGVHYDTRNALAHCKQATTPHTLDRDYESTCRRAQQKVDECTAFRDGWLKRREAYLARAPQAGLAEASQTLAKLEMPSCPAYLPDTWKTPEQAIAEVKGGKEDKPVAAAPQPQATQSQGGSLGGRWMNVISGQMLSIDVTGSLLSMVSIGGEDAGYTMHWERVTTDVYRMKGKPECVLSVLSESALEGRCESRKLPHRFERYQVVADRARGRYDLTGTWGTRLDNGVIAPFADIAMHATGLMFIVGTKSYPEAKEVNFTHAGTNAYKWGRAEVSAASGNAITWGFDGEKKNLVRMTAQLEAAYQERIASEQQEEQRQVSAMNGWWQCDNGRLVEQFDASAAGFNSRGDGASGNFYWRKERYNHYTYTFPDGNKAVVEFLGTDTLRQTLPDGTTATCHKQ